MGYQSTSLLISASDRGDFETVKRLLEQGENVDQKDQNQECALFRAATRGHYQIIRLLLQYGANVNATNGLLNYSALMEACRDNHIKSAELLLNHGANVDMQGSDGRSALMISCLNGHTQTAKLLLDYGANINMQSNKGGSALMCSCLKGHTETAKLLLDYSSDVNMQNTDKWSALMYSSQNGHTEIARLLLNHKANINMQESDGWSALMLSSQNGHIETAKLLLDHGANVNMQDSEGWTALMISSLYGHTKTSKLLLDHTANINVQESDGWSALMLSSQDGHTETAKLLLDHGANVNEQNNEGWSALMISSQNGHTETAKLLLDHGADSNMQNNEGWSALMYSSQNGHTETAKLLQCYGANVNMQNNNGASALYLSSQNGYSEIAKFLLEFGANVSMQNHNGASALYISCQQGHKETAKLLIKHCADVNMQHNSGSSALMFAVQNGCIDTVKLLIHYKADVNIQLSNGFSPLMYASQCGYTEIAKVLINHGANVNALKKNRQSVLMVACQNGHTEVAQTLLEHGADPRLQDIDGWTALLYAQNSGHNEIIELLRSIASIEIKTTKPSVPVSKSQTTKFTGQTLKPPSSYYAPRQSWGTYPRSVDSGYASTRHSPASSLGDVPSPTPSVGATYSEFGHPPNPAEPFLLLSKTPSPAKHSALMPVSSLATTVLHTGHQDITEHIIAETSVLVTNSEQLFSWDEYGLSLHIPENSLPNNLQHCSIHIKALIMGDYQLPQDTHLVSAVYWIECVPKCQFSRLLTLEIQHCAKPENASKLCFIKATSIDYHEERVMFETIAGYFSSCSSYGFIELDSFSRYGVGQKGVKDRQYCASCYYCDDPHNVHKIYFTITWNTKVHNEIIREYYDKMNAVKGHDQKVGFKEDAIRMDIPFPSLEGITTVNGGWRIMASGPPVIEKKEVDNFKTGKRIPSCQLIAECKTEQPADLKHSVTLSGAKDPHAAFLIYRRCHPGTNTESGHNVEDTNIGSATATASVATRKRGHEDHGATDSVSGNVSTEAQGTGRKRGHSDPEGVDSEPGPSDPKRSRTTDDESSQPEVTSPPNFTTLLIELLNKVSADWEDIGLILKLEQGDLSSIKSDHQEAKKCFREMLKLWLKQINPPPTWSAIISAIEVLEYKQLAEELKKKYCN